MAKRSRRISRRKTTNKRPYHLAAGLGSIDTARSMGRLAYKAYKSYTSSQKKRRGSNRYMSIRGDSGNINADYKMVKNPNYLPKWAKREFPLQTNYRSDAGVVETTSGLQQWRVAQYVCSPYELKTWYGGATDFSVTGTLSTEQAQAQLYVDKVWGHFVMKNFANTQAQVVLYDIMCKKTAYTTGTATSPTPLVDEIARGIGAAYNEQIGTTLTNNTHRRVGMTPKMSQNFNNHFKINYSKSFSLDPGSQVTYKYKYGYNKRFMANSYVQELINSYNTESTNTDAGNLAAGTQACYALAGWTRIILLKVTGTPVVDSLTPTLCNTGDAKIGYTVYEQQQYRLINQLRNGWTIVNDRLKDNAITSGNQKMILEDSDIAATYAEA